MAVSEQATTCLPNGSSPGPSQAARLSGRPDQWLAVSPMGLLPSTSQSSALFRVGPAVLVPAGDGKFPCGSGLKPKKEKMGLDELQFVHYLTTFILIAVLI